MRSIYDSGFVGWILLGISPYADLIKVNVLL